MGGRRLPECSFCRKPMKSQAAAEAHERDCVMLEHGRIIPRDVPVVITVHKSLYMTYDDITASPQTSEGLRKQIDTMAVSMRRLGIPLILDETP